MATHSVAQNQVAVHRLALAANTEEIVQFAEDLDQVEVVQISGTDPVYFSTNGQAAAIPADGAASHCYSTVQPLVSVALDPRRSTATQVRLICATAAVVSVTRG